MFSGLSSRFRRSISFRLALFFTLGFSVCLVAALAFSYLEVSFSLERASQEVISAKWREVSTVFAKTGIEGLGQFLSTEQSRIRNAPFLIRILSKEGAVIYLKPSVQEETFEFEKAFLRYANPENAIGWHALEAVNDEDKFDIMTDRVGDNFFLQVGRSSEDREDVLERIFLGFFTAAFILILMSAVIGLWYARRSLAPIRRLTDTISSIERGDLSRRVPLGSSQDELREVGLTFNRMIDRIETLIRAMKESLDNISHDIRTPLTRIRALAERALISKNPEQTILALEECAENVVEISGLVDRLLDISEADAGTLRLKLEDVNLKTMLGEVAEIYDFVAQEKNIKVLVTASDDLKWTMDRRRMKQVVGNLLDNALKYSPENTTVELSAFGADSALSIEVRDQGAGIALEDLPHIWDRLYRADKSRSTKGIGLGLSLVKSIVQAHRGRVDVRKNSDAGSTFLVQMPSPIDQA